MATKRAIALSKDKTMYERTKQSMKEKYGKLAKDILFGLAFTGSFAILASTPAYFLLPLLKEISDEYTRKKLKEKRVDKIFERFKKRRLIILKEENGKFIVELTEKGKRKVKEIQFENLKIEKPKKWDRKWWVVIFDIPEKFKKRARNALREKLKELDFYQLQKSVWVFPYSCEKEIQFLCELFDITPFVNILIADNIYNDIKLRKHFKLLGLL